MRRLGLGSAAAIVIANMVGAGVFTTSGFALADLGSREWVIAAWVVGGVIALCGALSYGAVARAIPEAGGEYTYLAQLVNPAAGFVAGWLSILAGFSAPMALAALSFEAYLGFDEDSLFSGWAATALVLLSGFAHGLHRSIGVMLQNSAVVMKVLLMTCFILFAFWVFARQGIAPAESITSTTTSSMPLLLDFAAVVVWVSFSYTGWNAAVYIAEDIREPNRILPRALLLGCIIVTLLYVGLNIGFLYALPIADASGQIAIAALAAEALGGPWMGRAMMVLVALALATSVLSLQMAGPRVIEKMARNGHLPLVLSARTDAPAMAVLFQSIVALICIWAAGFTELLIYAGLGLSVCSTIVVISLVRLRLQLGAKKVPIPGYPWVPYIFIIASLLIITLSALRDPSIAIWTLLTALLGFGTYFVQQRWSILKETNNEKINRASFIKSPCS